MSSPLLRESILKMRQRVLRRFPWMKPLAKKILGRAAGSPRGVPGRSLARRLLGLVGDPYKDYLRVEAQTRCENQGLYLETIAAMPHKPRFSIVVPIYNTPRGLLPRCLQSVESQLYPHWELILVNDASPDPSIASFLAKYCTSAGKVKLHTRPTNGGISQATNDGIALATGEFVALLDHDDELSPDALYFLAERLNKNPHADILYTDQDKISDHDQSRSEPFFKPDWSPEYFRGVMYFGHLLAVRRSLLMAIRKGGSGGGAAGVEPKGPSDTAFNGVQDFEMALRLVEVTNRIEHIPRICYHWRTTPGSVANHTAAKPDLGRLQVLAVQQHLDRLAIPATAQAGNEHHRVRLVPRTLADPPLISILICTKDAPEFISRCLESIFQKTSYGPFEVLVADNNTTDPAALKVLERHPIRRFSMPEKFHFAAFNNRLAREARGEFLLFLNNDTEVLDAAWLNHLLLYARQPDAGAVGPVLLFPDNSVQHAGVILGPRGTADHVMRNFPAASDGYFGSLAVTRDVTAVTAACLMVAKSRFNAAGGFNELFRNHYEDVDLNLRLRQSGLRNICVAGTRLIHHESKTRKANYDYNDRILLLDYWEDLIDKGDPFYNANFHPEHFDYTLSTRELTR